LGCSGGGLTGLDLAAPPPHRGGPLGGPEPPAMDLLPRRPRGAGRGPGGGGPPPARRGRAPRAGGHHDPRGPRPPPPRPGRVSPARPAAGPPVPDPSQMPPR